MKLKKKFALILVLVIFTQLAVSSSDGIIPNNEQQGHPFFLVSGDSNPSSVSGSFVPGDTLTFNGSVEVAGGKGVYDTFFLSNSSNPNVGQQSSSSVGVEVFEKGIIPNQESEGDPFFIESGDSNPQSFSGSFTPSDSLSFSAEINATGALGNYSTFFISNSSNPNVGQVTSNQETVEIVNISTYEETVSQNISADDETGSTGDQRRETDDSTSVGQVVGDTVNWGRDYNRQIQLVDATSILRSIDRALSDTVSVGNVVDRSVDWSREYSQSMQFNSFADSSLVLNRQPVDSISILDDVVGGKIYNLEPEQGIQFNTVVSTVEGFRGSVDQDIGVVDVADRTVQVFRETDDVVQTFDAIDVVRDVERDAVQDTNVLSSTSLLPVFFEGQTQPVNISQNVDRNQSVNRTNDQSLDVLDISVALRDVERSGSDTVVVVDVLGRTLTASREPIEQDISVDSITVRSFDLARSITDSITVSGTVDRTVNVFRSFVETGSIEDSVDPERDIIRNPFQSILTEFTVFENSPPVIENVEFKAVDLGENRSLSLLVEARDPDGSNDRDRLMYNGNTKVIEDGTGSVVELDIGTDLTQNTTITLVDENGASDTFDLGFELTNNPYNATGDTLDNQTINKTDTYTVTYASGTTDYNISHNLFNYEEITSGGTFTGSIQEGDTITLTSDAYGDFLDQTRQWHTVDSAYNTVDNQSIAETLNVTSQVPGVTWEDVNTTGTTVPQIFQPCNNCGSTEITFVDSYSNLSQNTDFGDGISNTFEQDITDVIIGERTEWWQEYRYFNQTAEVKFNNIWANATLEENNTDYPTPFIRVQSSNSWNNTLLPEVTNTCTSENPSTNSITIDGKTWKGCAQNVNGVQQPEFLKVQIPDFDNLLNWRVRYGLGEKPAEQFFYQLGDTCGDDISLEDPAMNEELISSKHVVNESRSLVCFRNRVVQDKDAVLDVRDVSRQLGYGVVGIIAFIILVIGLVLVFYLDIGNGLTSRLDEGFPSIGSNNNENLGDRGR